MTVDIYDILHQSSELLLFIILGLGLAFGKVNFGPVRLGSTIGVLLAALAFGKMGFYLAQDIQKAGFMLFIFCVGIEAGPYFFSVFLRDSKLYVSLALCLTLTAVGITLAIAYVYHLDKGITAGILAQKTSLTQPDF